MIMEHIAFFAVAQSQIYEQVGYNKTIQLRKVNLLKHVID